MRHTVIKRALLALLAACSTVAMAAQEVAGDWFGVVEVSPGNHLPLLVHIKRDDAGVLSGTMGEP